MRQVPMMRQYKKISFFTSTLVCVLVLTNAVPGVQIPGPTQPCERSVDIMGDFVWARARGMENAVFVDANGNQNSSDKSHIFSSVGTQEKYLRNNFTSLRGSVAYTAQIKTSHLRSPKPFNAKIMLGYMNASWKFTHGDNKDLVHWADVDRVVLFVPYRHAENADPNNQNNYFISPYGGQTISVLELKAGEAISYAWYSGGAGNLDEHILFDLYPHCGGQNDLKPCVNHPIFKFEVFDQGRWKVSIERDGRDGLAGGAVDGDYDMVFTESSQGAKPYTVDLGDHPQQTLSIYHPSSDYTPSDILLKVEPFSRVSGEPLDQFDRVGLQKNVTCEQLDAHIDALEQVGVATEIAGVANVSGPQRARTALSWQSINASAKGGSMIINPAGRVLPGEITRGAGARGAGIVIVKDREKPGE